MAQIELWYASGRDRQCRFMKLATLQPSQVGIDKFMIFANGTLAPPWSKSPNAEKYTVDIGDLPLNPTSRPCPSDAIQQYDGACPVGYKPTHHSISYPTGCPIPMITPKHRSAFCRPKGTRVIQDQGQNDLNHAWTALYLHPLRPQPWPELLVDCFPPIIELK